jgi:hypothetical protein
MMKNGVGKLFSAGEIERGRSTGAKLLFFPGADYQKRVHEFAGQRPPKCWKMVINT